MKQAKIGIFLEKALFLAISIIRIGKQILMFIWKLFSDCNQFLDS